MVAGKNAAKKRGKNAAKRRGKKAAKKPSRSRPGTKRKTSAGRREDAASLRKRARTILRRLHTAHPDAECALRHSNPLELLVATILSAQCTDERVNKVTRDLFKKYRAASDYVEASRGDLEETVRATGFFRSKSKSIQNCCRALVEKHGGKVPGDLDALVELPGVGRKTANLVLGTAFGIPGIVVDTHVKRLTNRMALTAEQDPVKIEFDLMPLIPEKEWAYFSHAMIFHGRRVCAARTPRCAECTLSDVCPSAEV